MLKEREILRRSLGLRDLRKKFQSDSVRAFFVICEMLDSARDGAEAVFSLWDYSRHGEHFSAPDTSAGDSAHDTSLV